MIGNTKAPSWQALFATESMVGDFQHGPGTGYPFDSMSLAQVSRYFWAAKRWRIECDYGYTKSLEGDPSLSGTGSGTLDTGFIPYLVDYDADGESDTMAGWSDGETLPTFLDRFTGYPSQYALNFYIPSTFTRDSDGETYDNTEYTYLTASMMGAKAFGCPFGVVLDEGVPGNAFMGFYVNFTTPDFLGNFLSTFAEEGWVDSGLTVELDGMSAPLYWAGAPDNIDPDSIHGTFTITTSDDE